MGFSSSPAPATGSNPVPMWFELSNNGSLSSTTPEYGVVAKVLPDHYTTFSLPSQWPHTTQRIVTQLFNEGECLDYQSRGIISSIIKPYLDRNGISFCLDTGTANFHALKALDETSAGWPARTTARINAEISYLKAFAAAGIPIKYILLESTLSKPPNTTFVIGGQQVSTETLDQRIADVLWYISTVKAAAPAELANTEFVLDCALLAKGDDWIAANIGGTTAQAAYTQLRTTLQASGYDITTLHVDHPWECFYDLNPKPTTKSSFARIQALYDYCIANHLKFVPWITSNSASSNAIAHDRSLDVALLYVRNGLKAHGWQTGFWIPAPTNELPDTATGSSATNSNITSAVADIFAHTFTKRLSSVSLSASAALTSASIGGIVGTLVDADTASTFSLTDSASGMFSLTGTTLKVAGTVSAGSHSITIRETQAGAADSPKDTVLTVEGVSADTFPTLSVPWVVAWNMKNAGSVTSSGGLISQITGSNGTTKTASASGSARPTLASYNGNDVAVFVGGQNFSCAAMIGALPEAIGVFAVVKIDDLTKNSALFDSGITASVFNLDRITLLFVSGAGWRFRRGASDISKDASQGVIDSDDQLVSVVGYASSGLVNSNINAAGLYETSGNIGIDIDTSGYDAFAVGKRNCSPDSQAGMHGKLAAFGITNGMPTASDIARWNSFAALVWGAD